MQFSRRLTLKGIADGSLPLTFVLVTICLYTPYFVDFITDHRVVASVPAFLSLPILDSTTALFAFRSYPPDPMTACASWFIPGLLPVLPAVAFFTLSGCRGGKHRLIACSCTLISSALLMIASKALGPDDSITIW